VITFLTWVLHSQGKNTQHQLNGRLNGTHNWYADKDKIPATDENKIHVFQHTEYILQAKIPQDT
jgi:hypothetical protein